MKMAAPGGVCRIVGAALCGRPGAAGAHAGAPLRIAMGAGIFIGVSMIRRLTTANENDRKAPPEPIVGAALCGRPSCGGYPLKAYFQERSFHDPSAHHRK